MVRHVVRLGVRVDCLHRLALAVGDVTDLENAMKRDLTEAEILADPEFLREAIQVRRKQLWSSIRSWSATSPDPNGWMAIGAWEWERDNLALAVKALEAME